MSELKPCPFCGGEADVLEFYDVEPDDVNFGGSCICCRQCGANSPVHFDRKENLYASWNDRIELRCSAVSAEPVAWRWRSIFNDSSWCYGPVMPTAHDQYVTEPLYVRAKPQTAPTKIADQDLRRRWREAGGEFYGPHVETGSMPEAKLLPFLRSLLNQSPHCQAESDK